MTREKVLVIEDEPDIREVMVYNLSREGYRVLEAKDGEKGLEKARREAPDLILLDLMLPSLDGVEVCRLLRSDPLTQAVPVIMVTAKSEESDVVLGFGVGADDYVAKPFSPKELLARVKAVLRRGNLREGSAATPRLLRGNLAIDTLRHEVTLDGEPIVLTATEFRLLSTLAAHPGRVFSRDALLNRVIGQNAVVVERNIDVHIRVIRDKLGNSRDMIETIRGVGYRFRDMKRI